MTLRRLGLITLAASSVLMQPIISEGANDNWISATVRYEGAPLALRVHKDIDTPQNERRFPQVVAIRLQLAKVRSDGMPEADYNDTLADLDSDLVELFETGSFGVTVLIETLGGRRTFYSYTQVNAPVQALVANLQKKYPGHAISVQTKSDPHWGLLASYRKQFAW